MVDIIGPETVTGTQSSLSDILLRIQIPACP